MSGGFGPTKNDLFLRELNLPHIYEVLAERFDGVMENLTKNALIYGGAIRDIIAKLDLVGDVDIAVNSHEASSLLHNFHTSSKWVGIQDLEREKKRNLESSDGRPSWAPKKAPVLSGTISRKDPYEGESSMRVKSVHTFTNSSDQKVQIVVSSASNLGPFDDSLFPARNVDIVCCGLAMNRKGQVFEVVFDAENQCRDLVLNYNDVAGLNIESLEKRVAKLTERGWKSEIDFAAVRKEMERTIKKAERKWKGKKHKGSDEGKLSKISFVTKELGPGVIELKYGLGYVDFVLEHKGRTATKRVKLTELQGFSPTTRNMFISSIKDELIARMTHSIKLNEKMGKTGSISKAGKYATATYGKWTKTGGNWP